MTHSATAAVVFAAIFAALYVGHHIGDYWVQTDHQAAHKGDPNREGKGRAACAGHVSSYLATQAVFVGLAVWGLGLEVSGWGLLIAFGISGFTHYWADRRWTLAWLAGLIPGKLAFFRLGVPRGTLVVQCQDTEREGTFLVKLDQPSLGTGGWALDQSFHLAWSVFFPALTVALAVRFGWS